MSRTKNISKKIKKPLKVSVVILAAGSSTRMGGADKITLPLCGKPVLEHSVSTFALCSDINEIIVVTREDLIRLALDICGRSGRGKASAVIKGGASRTESAYLGVMKADRNADIILIHDAARPLVTAEIINAGIKAAAEYGAALPAVPVKDTLKENNDGFVVSTPDRSRLYAAQTRRPLIPRLLRPR